MSTPPASRVSSLYDLLVAITNHLQSPLLVFARLVWGIQLVQAGVGKLQHIDVPIAYFKNDLHIPFPVENAWLVAFTETFGGIFLTIGLLTRLTAIPLIINFIVAYLTAGKGELPDLLKFDTSKFAGDLAFAYLATAVLVFVFGPGAYSLDYLITRWRGGTWCGPGL